MNYDPYKEWLISTIILGSILLIAGILTVIAIW